MEEVLLGSMSNTVSISSSGCSSGQRCRGSQNWGVHPLLPPSPNLHLVLNAIFCFPRTAALGCSPGGQKEDRDAGCPSEYSIPKNHNGGKVRRVGIGIQI